MKTAESLSSLDEVHVGGVIHRSNENVCHSGKFRGRDVVIKRVIVSREDSLDMFEEEVKILTQPELGQSVVAPLVVVRAAPHYSIVMPLMENGSVNNLIKGDALPLRLTVCLALDSAHALAKIHEQRFVHRDIKSANILVDSEWRAWVTDLGSAELAFDESGNAIIHSHDTANLSQPSGGFFKKNINGTTLGYSAPEVLRNTPAVQASDVYGLAMTIAEMLTGLPPFQGMEKEDADMHTVMDSTYSEHALIKAIVMDHLRPGLVTTSEKEGMPMELINLVREMWNPDEKVRPSASQCVSRLEAIAKQIGLDTSFGARGEYAQEMHTARAAALSAAMDESDDVVASPPHAPGATSNANGDVNVPEGFTVSKSGVHQQKGNTYQVFDVATVSIDAEMMDAETAGEASVVGQRLKFNPSIPVGAFATSGRRGADKMEDRHAVAHFGMGTREAVMTVLTVFDGHGGAACAEFSNRMLAPHLGQALIGVGSDIARAPTSAEERAAIVSRAFVECDLAFRNGPTADKSGCTAMAAALWHPDPGTNKPRLLIANAGDCRAVLCRVGKDGKDTAVRLSRDHNAQDPEEQERIKLAGGTISFTRDGKARVQGHIQVTRAIGDGAMKPFGVTAEPEIGEFDLDADAGDDFVILATDGVWDTLTDAEAVRMVRNTAKECGLAAKRIGGEALARGSTDNITCAVMFLKKFDQHDDTVFV